MSLFRFGLFRRFIFGIVDASRFNPDTIMPPYYRIEGLTRVAPAFQGKPILTAEQIEDVVAYLATLRDERNP